MNPTPTPEEMAAVCHLGKFTSAHFEMFESEHDMLCHPYGELHLDGCDAGPRYCGCKTPRPMATEFFGMYGCMVCGKVVQT